MRSRARAGLGAGRRVSVTLLVAALMLSAPEVASAAVGLEVNEPLSTQTPLLVPEMSPGQGTVWSEDGWLAVWSDPEFEASVCEEVDGFDFEVVTDDAAASVVAQGSTPAVESWWDAACVHGTWRLAAGTLTDGGQYGVRSRSRLDDVVSDWSATLPLPVAYGPNVPDPGTPIADEAVTHARPTLTATLHPRDGEPLQAIFNVVQAETDISVAQSLSPESVDASGAVSWTVPHDLPIGRYEWQVLAWDGVSQSDWSPRRPFTISLPPPTGPMLWSASNAARNTIRDSWLPPFTGDDDPIIDYTIRVAPGNHTLVVPSSTTAADVTGIPPGDYTATVVARNQRGSSPASNVATVKVWPATPLAVQNLQYTLDGTSATITWDAPADEGDSPVTHYDVLPWWATSFPAQTTTTRSATLTDLVVGAWYNVAVRPFSAIGAGELAAIGFAPVARPDPPSDVTVLLGDAALDVSWQPAFDGGTYVHSYVVTASPGGHHKTVTGGGTSVHFDGLENGVAYSFTVTAINDVGESDPSLPSSPRAPAPETADADGDGLPDILEERAGSNSALPDSDFDGLSDRVEVLQLFTFTSPTSIDSDSDGIGDADADSDGDGLTNAHEVSAGLEPANRDTDGDAVLDGDEITQGIDPTTRDTDADGLEDGDELRLGLNPGAADSDGDGTPDADASISTELSQGAAAIDVTGTPGAVLELQLTATETEPFEGAIAGVVTVTRSEASDEASAAPATAASRGASAAPATAAASRVVSAAPAAVVTGSLTFDVANVHDLADRQLGIFAWDPGTGSWQQTSNKVTVGEHTVSVTSPELGTTYTVVDLAEWSARARECDAAASGAAPLNLEVVVDETPSMGWADPTGERYAAVARVVSSLAPGDSARLRTFGVTWVNYGFGNTYEEAHTNGPSAPAGGTSVDRVRTQLAMLSEQPHDLDHDPDAEMEMAERALGGLGFASVARPTSPFLPEGASPLLGQCRKEAVVLVTDGTLKPSEDAPLGVGPVPFLERTEPPVHVLDVGTGGQDADWLRQVATQTGGTYSHVPTAQSNPQWARGIDLGPWDTAQMTADDDGDGLSNWVELFGITAATASGVRGGLGVAKNIFFSDPQDSDTDNDGLRDGEEAGVPLTTLQTGGWSTNLPVTSYLMVSDPADVDGDHDGLTDTEEVESGNYNPLNADPDGDGLEDGGEADWGINPFVADYDHDGFLDGHEDLNANSGLDPTVHNTVISNDYYIEHFLLGAFCGDINYCRRDTIPWLLGNLTSSFLVYGDVRDLVSAAVEARPSDGVIAAAGLVPLPLVEQGQGVAKTGRFIARVRANTDAAVSARKLLQRVADGDAVKVVDELFKVYPDLVTHLRDLNMTADSIARLIVRNNPDHLTDALTRPNVQVKLLDAAAHASGDAVHGFLKSGRSGERTLRRSYGLSPDGSSGCWKVLLTCRFPDAITPGANGGEILHEAKVGYVTKMFSMVQILKDDAIRSSRSNVDILWHFYASSRTGRIGASKTFLDELEAFNIPFVLHLPR